MKRPTIEKYQGEFENLTKCSEVAFQEAIKQRGRLVKYIRELESENKQLRELIIDSGVCIE